jgi:23S rRNA pseudouridine2457 synthase|tara:strand:+ start:4088 stop:4684 length:597 start_codon:yes stop_codon:yes gene_type:complete
MDPLTRHPKKEIMPFILFNKPYGVVSQFSGGDNTLAKFITENFVYPAGRLDKKSEGLLALTDDGKLQARICEPKQKLLKYYIVQVEGDSTHDHLKKLTDGLTLKDGLATAHSARIINPPKNIWDREPPIRFRANIPTSWLEISIFEGRKHQIRRMAAAINLPVLRLVRWQIGPWFVKDLALGQCITMTNEEAWLTLNP